MTVDILVRYLHFVSIFILFLMPLLATLMARGIGIPLITE